VRGRDDEEFVVGAVVFVGRDGWEKVLERDGLAVGTLDTA